MTNWRAQEAAKAGIRATRQALGQGMPAPGFANLVVETAELAGWRVHWNTSSDAFPAFLAVRDGRLLVAHVGPAGPSYKTQEWLAALGRVPGVETAVWTTRGGLEPVEQALQPRVAAPTAEHPDGGRRGD